MGDFPNLGINLYVLSKMNHEPSDIFYIPNEKRNVDFALLFVINP